MTFDEVRDEFLPVNSHELRTPLTTILGFASLLAQRWDAMADAHRRELVARIEHQARRMSAVVEDLLLLTRVRSGALELTLQPVAARVAVAEALGRLGPAAATVAVTCPEGSCVLGDAARVVRILHGLLANAPHHGAEPVTVEVRPPRDRGLSSP
jgi:signal transduction histidine kinase